MKSKNIDLSFKQVEVDDIPKHRKEASEDTKKLLDSIRSSKGVIRLEFKNKHASYQAYLRVKYAEKTKQISCHEIARRGNCLYIKI